MSKRNKTSNEEKSVASVSRLQEKTLNGIIAVSLFVIAIFFVLAALGLGGPIGKSIYDKESLFSLTKLFGVGYFLLPIILGTLAISFFRSLQKKIALTQSIGGLVLFISGLGIISTVSHMASNDTGMVGGIVGSWISSPFIKLFDVYATLIFLIALALISILVMFDVNLADLLMRKKIDEDEEDVKKKDKKLMSADLDASELKKMDDARKATEKGIADNQDRDDKKAKEVVDLKKSGDDFTVNMGPKQNRVTHSEFTPLPLSLLEGDKGKPGVGDIKANANIIKRTFLNFGISVEMDEVSIGPSITRYALKPAEGVKLSRIIALNNDLALALAAHPIRIEAPIPGKSLVGIEIPNSVKTTVGLANLIGDPEYQKSEKPLLVTLGKGISGKSHFANLAKAPHMLIAGATGSGKS